MIKTYTVKINWVEKSATAHLTFLLFTKCDKSARQHHQKYKTLNKSSATIYMQSRFQVRHERCCLPCSTDKKAKQTEITTEKGEREKKTTYAQVIAYRWSSLAGISFLAFLAAFTRWSRRSYVPERERERREKNTNYYIIVNFFYSLFVKFASLQITKSFQKRFESKSGCHDTGHHNWLQFCRICFSR